MKQLPERCEACRRQIATLETCVLPDGTEKRGAEVTFRESAEGGLRCRDCTLVTTSVQLVKNGRVVAEIPCEVERLGGR